MNEALSNLRHAAERAVRLLSGTDQALLQQAIDECLVVQVTVPPQGEPLTIAYVAKGMADYLGAAPNDMAMQAMVDHLEGEMNIVERGVGYAAQLDAMANAIDDASGVFLYEVAEEFGSWIAKHMHINSGRVVENMVQARMQGLISNWRGKPLPN